MAGVVKWLGGAGLVLQCGLAKRLTWRARKAQGARGAGCYGTGVPCKMRTTMGQGSRLASC